jgi:hypothetical protein
MRITLRFTLAVAILATAYYLLLTFVIVRFPWATPPSWWWRPWPSKHAAVLAWLQALNIVGSLTAAVPIAVVIAFFVKESRYAVATCVAVAIALVVVVSSLVDYPPWSSTKAVDLWLTDLIYFVALCGAPLLLLWLISLLPSNNRFERSRGSSSLGKVEDR